MKTTPEQKLQEHLLLRAVPGDRLVLADSTLQAALDGSRALTAKELQAMQQSPLTLRRFRHLAVQRRAIAAATAAKAAASAWQGSRGMLRAAASATSATETELATDDGAWALHFLLQDGAWQVILKLEASAPFAALLMSERPMLRVCDGAGALVLEGRLDADGECECAWPFAQPPTAHMQQNGAIFTVEPLRS